MTHTSYYTSQDLDAETWSVYREQYWMAGDDEPIEGSQEHVSTHSTEAEADGEAGRLYALANRGPTKTERVEYAPTGHARDTWFGTIVRRFVAADNGVERRMAVVRFGTPTQHGPEHFMDERELIGLTYTTSVLVEHDTFPSPEDSALALIEWLNEEENVIYVHAKGSDGVDYNVAVTRGDDGKFTARLEGA